MTKTMMKKKTDSMEAPLQKQELLKGLMEVENSIRAGWNKNTSRWNPIDSLEGGTPTLAYGHKLSEEEHRIGKVFLIKEDGAKLSFTWRIPGGGLTELQAIDLLKSDYLKHENLARRDWDNFFINQKSFDSLPWKYKGLLIDKAFNTGRLANSHRGFIWRSLAEDILTEEKDNVKTLKDATPFYRQSPHRKVYLYKRIARIGLSLGYDKEVVARYRSFFET